MGSEEITLRDLDEYEFREIIEESLREDNISESCYTNFKDALADTVYRMVHEKFGRSEWDLNYFERNKEEKVFNAFMKNSEFEVLLTKKGNEGKDMSKKVIVRLNFSEDEKKRIAETYIDTLLEGYCYLNICIFLDLDEVNVDTVSRVLSDEVCQILSPEEIKAKFEEKIKEAIRIIEDADSNE
jgi:hypothetical protein